MRSLPLSTSTGSKAASLQRRTRRVFTAMVCMALLCLETRGTPRPEEPALLTQGNTIEGQLSGDGSQEYRFVLQAGQYARISVEQSTIDLTVACIGPAETGLFETDSYAVGETENVELVGDVSGSYRLRLRASDAHASIGRYAITL